MYFFDKCLSLNYLVFNSPFSCPIYFVHVDMFHPNFRPSAVFLLKSVHPLPSIC